MPCLPARRVAALLLAALLLVAALAGCGTAVTPPPGTGTAPGALPSAAPVVPPAGPYRHTARASFRWRVAPVTAERLGVSYRAGCPVPVEDLRLLQVTHLGFDARPHAGQIVVHRAHAAAVVEVFRRLYEARFPIERMVTVEEYGGSDDRSMAANNTSGFNCRSTTGGSGWSEHAYGTAIDVNPVQNPYVSGSAVLPEAGRRYVDRSHVRPGMVVDGDAVVAAFAGAGWGWGGHFRSVKDYQHFSASGR
jgi:hypothetical protein